MCSRIDMHTHVAPHPGPSPPQRLKPNLGLKVRIWPFELRVSACSPAMDYMSTDFNADSSTAQDIFLLERGQTHRQTDVTERPTPCQRLYSRKPALVIKTCTCMIIKQWWSHQFVKRFFKIWCILTEDLVKLQAVILYAVNHMDSSVVRSWSMCHLPSTYLRPTDSSLRQVVSDQQSPVCIASRGSESFCFQQLQTSNRLSSPTNDQTNSRLFSQMTLLQEKVEQQCKVH